MNGGVIFLKENVIFPKEKACFLVIEMIIIFMLFIFISHVLKKVTYYSDLATGSVARSFERRKYDDFIIF